MGNTSIHRYSEGRTLSTYRHERLLAAYPVLTFYTNGSGIDGHNGAAAVNSDLGAVRQNYVSVDPELIEYSGELIGITLTLEIAIDLQKATQHPGQNLCGRSSSQQVIKKSSIRSSWMSVCSNSWSFSRAKQISQHSLEWNSRSRSQKSAQRC